MKSLVPVLVLATLAPLFPQAQELRLRGDRDSSPRAADYWDELEPVPVEPAAPEKPRIDPVEIPAWQTRYTLGPGDTLTFSIYDRPDLTRENVRIAPDGTVSYLQAVAVRAEGLTLDELRTRIESELSQYQKNAKVVITPAEVASKSFSIIGRVKSPGSYTLDRPTSILEAIARADGIQIGSVRGSAFELADFERSFVARDGRKLDVDLAELYYEGDFSENAFLEPEDYIYVASNVDNEIYVLGAVDDPGRRKMPVNLTLAQAIGEAGGFTDAAFRRKVLVVRGSIHDPQPRVVDMRAVLRGEAKDVQLKSRDIVYVSERPFEMVERVLDNAIFTFMQTVTAEAMNQNYEPFLLGN